MDRMGFYILLRTRSDTFHFPALRPAPAGAQSDCSRSPFGNPVIDSLNHIAKVDAESLFF
jgi:hypothetical protein